MPELSVNTSIFPSFEIYVTVTSGNITKMSVRHLAEEPEVAAAAPPTEIRN